MENELKKIKEEAINKQKESIIEELAVLRLHLGFAEDMIKKIKVKTKEEIEQRAHKRLEQITPVKTKIEHKTNYYHYLCALSDTASAEVEKPTDTSKEL